MPPEPFKPDDTVKTCCKLESGLFMHVHGLRACVRGAFMTPVFLAAEEITQGNVSREIIAERRKQCIAMLNDDHSDMDCKRCLMVEYKRYGDISFSRLGHVDVQHYSNCNLRCSYCAYTRDDVHLPPQYDALAVLRCFSQEDVEWNAHVDFAGGEPTLLENLGEYLDYFKTRRIRVLMHTNAVIFHQTIYDGLADGSLYWVTTSLDAGTPSAFAKLRGKDCYLQVLENLSRYAMAGSKGKGMLSVKYIFTDSNCGDDDIAGFAYAMLALRPQQVWLTFDFTPLFLRQENYDYSRQIDAYAKLYLLLKKHGIEAFHYYKEAIASFSQEGKDIMAQILSAIESKLPLTPLGHDDLLYKNFRDGLDTASTNVDTFALSPLTLIRQGSSPVAWSLKGKRILLAPACPRTKQLLADEDIAQADWIGLVDRNPIQQGKYVEGRLIYGYEAIADLHVDAILVAAPEKHRHDILKALVGNSPQGVQIAELV